MQENEYSYGTDVPADWQDRLGSWIDNAPRKQVAISREDRIALSNDMAVLSKSLRIVPHIHSEGFIDGFRLSGIRRSSIFFRLQLKNGDIVMAYNGKPLTKVEDFMKMYEDWSQGADSTFLIQRRKRYMVLEYTNPQ